MKDSLQLPSFTEERVLEEQGYRLVAGIDEVGRGALAGPVAAAAVILPQRLDAPWLSLVRDSKQLTPLKREFLFQHIRDVAVSIGVGLVSPRIIDSRGIIKATRLAMQQAVKQLVPEPDFLLIDYVRLLAIKLPQKGITHGDSLCFSIACASIVAKVTRDRLMVKLDKRHKGYEMAHHKGYGTGEHLACLSLLGPSPVHRRTFRPVKEMIQGLL
ncbi:ribonuclease HII [Chloroflexota bacterium]